MDARSHNRHLWLMVLCCLIPVAVLGVAVLAGVPLTGVLALALVLLCPLSHLLMMSRYGHARPEHPTSHTHGQESE